MSNNNKNAPTTKKEKLPAKLNSPQVLEEVTEQAAQRAAVIVSKQFAGPIPPPDMFKKYDQVVSGAAERILKMAENQSNHRIQIENKLIDSDIKNRNKGQIFAFIIGVLALLIGGFLIYSDKNASGLAVILTSLGGIITAFFYGSHKKSKERVQKKESANK